MGAGFEDGALGLAIGYTSGEAFAVGSVIRKGGIKEKLDECRVPDWLPEKTGAMEDFGGRE